MKKHWLKKISIILTALLLLFVLSVPALAEKESEAEVPAAVSAEAEVPDEVSADTLVPEKATASDAVPEKATSSDAYEDGELLDGIVSNDIVPSEEEEVPAAEVIVPEEIPAAAELPAEVPEKKEAIAPADISGTWTIDGVTTYRFEKDGTGALILPEHEYLFEYSLDEDELTLEFEDTSINTPVFTFTVEDDTLILKREGEFGTSEFILEKIAD